MKRINITNRFKKDLARCAKRGYGKEKFEEILDLLERDLPLPAKCRPHVLVGDWAGHVECHIGPDWLLIYKNGDEEINLVATGTHSDIF